jgi:hypothetical protein
VRTQAQIEALLKAKLALAEKRRRDAVKAYRHLVPEIKRLRAEGWSYSGIADRLTADGHRSRAGGPMNAALVWRIVRRAGG